MECFHKKPLLFPFLFTLLFSFSFSVSLLFFSLYIRRRRSHHQSPPGISDIVYNHKDVNHSKNKTLKPLDSSPANNALLLEILPAALFADDGELAKTKDEPLAVDDRKKKKKRRGKKKRYDADDSSKPEGDREVIMKECLFIGGNKEVKKQDLVCFYPFTSSSSATQRKIKKQYDQLVKSHESSGLTLLQVGQFVNCLIEAREELKHKSEVIQRKFTITRALLFKADRSSFDRLRQQIYKLELEQKRLEEDAFVYNWLQQQLKLSPAYKKMLEIGAYMDLKAKSGELMEDTDSDISDISFEELLAQEKKDSFWQKKGKPRLCSD